MKLTFTQKLASIIGILVIVSMAIAWFGINGAGEINGSLNKIVNQDAEKVKLASRVQQNLLEMHRAEKNMILAITETDMDEYGRNYESAKKEVLDRTAKLRDLVDSSNKIVIDNFKAASDDFARISEQVQSLTKENSNEKAKALLRGDAREKLLVVDKLTDELREIIKKDANDELDKTETNAKVIKQKVRALELVSSIESNMLKTVRDTGRAILLVRDKDIKEMADRSNKFLSNLYEDIKKLKIITDENKNQLVDKTLEAVKEYDKIQTEILRLTSLNSNQRAFEMSSGEGKKAIEKARNLVFKIAEDNDKSMDAAKVASDENYASIRNMNIGIAVGGIVLAVIIAMIMVKQMMNMITNSVNSVSEGAEQVASASNQISSSSQQLAEGAQEQAASVEEITSSLSEIKATTEQNSENAREADMLAKTTNESARMGYDHIKELNKSMEEINDSSRRISNIIKTIDEIAFQTNLLALNAAVEAARAGEHGLGFAVVAEEVRNLAQRSAEAAKDTANIIESSIEQVKKGNQITEQTNKAFEDILDKVKKTGDIVGEIAIASKEQSTGINQLSEAMSQVDSVTQVMASNSEESAAASEEMSAQATTMRTTITELASIFGIVTESAHVTKKVIHHELQNVKKSSPKSTQMMTQSKKPSEVLPLDDDDLKEF